MFRLTPYIVIFAIITSLFSCADDESFSTDWSYRLSFTEDTISFDTILSTIGSSTKRVNVFNDYKKGIRIKNVKLGSGGTSGFRFNIDGRTGPSVDDLEVLKKDSIFLFVDVNIPEQGKNTPVEYKDSLIFTLESGVVQKMMLVASGQDVIILRAKEYTKGENAVLTADKPYLIYDSLKVDSDATLTIEAGATLYFHSDVSLIVEGTLHIKGDESKMTTLRGDRMDRLLPYLPYDRTAGLWGGILLRSSSYGNSIDYADIHGGKYGVVCDSTGMEVSKLTITNSVIHNVSGYGFYTNSNKILAENTQFSNAYNNCVTVIGGDCEFNNCTIVQFYPWRGDRKNALYLSNVDADKDNAAAPLQRLNLNYCVVTGYANDEVFGDKYKGKTNEETESVAFNILFDHCFVNTDISSEYFVDCLLDAKENATYREKNFKVFDTKNFIYDFHLDSLSAAYDKGMGIR